MKKMAEEMPEEERRRLACAVIAHLEGTGKTAKYYSSFRYVNATPSAVCLWKTRGIPPLSLDLLLRKRKGLLQALRAQGFNVEVI